MSVFRTPKAQITGLEQIQKRCPGSRLSYGLGDVPALAYPESKRELVFAVGGFDGWDAGTFVVEDMCSDDATKWLRQDRSPEMRPEPARR